MRIQGRSRESLSRETERRLAERLPGGLLRERFDHFLALADHSYRLTGEHSERVAIFAEEVARKLGLNEAEAYHAGLGHDIGKIICRDDLVDGREIDTDELVRVKKHALASYFELSGADPRIASIAGIHHAVYDRGYGLRIEFLRKNFSVRETEEIITLGAVVSVCDWIDSRLCRTTDAHEPNEGMTAGDWLRIKYRDFPAIVEKAIAEARKLYGIDLDSRTPFPADQQ